MSKFLWGNGRVLVALQICGKKTLWRLRRKEQTHAPYYIAWQKSQILGNELLQSGLSRGRDLWYLHAQELVDTGYMSRGETFPGWTKCEFGLTLNPILVVFDCWIS